MIDESVIERIQGIYSACSYDEQMVLRQILQEIADTGDSETYHNVWLADFKEMPVSIEQFISDPYYLGETTKNGAMVYPFWKQTLTDIFNHGNQYNEIILSGATRIGKTSTSVKIMAYMLYRLMLYRDPQGYFGLQPNSKLTLAFANLTKDLAAGVAFTEFNQALKHSKWFMEHGSMNRGTVNQIYMPDGDIEIIAGSSASNFLGMQIWCCLVGSTKVRCATGVKTLEECSRTFQSVVLQYDKKYKCVIPHIFGNIQITKYVNDTVRVVLTDGTNIEGTPDHRFLLDSGEYKSIGELCISDKLKLLDNKDVQILSISKIHYDDPIPVYDVLNAYYHNFVVIGNTCSLIAHNCMMDETNFAKSGVKDISLAKEHMKHLYDTVNARVSGTFRIKGDVYGKIIAASSKNTDSDFLSDHIESQLNAGNTHLYLVDQPQWVVQPKEKFSSNVFHFTVGDRYKKGFVIPPENDDEEHRQEYLKQGYKVMEAPAEFRRNFTADYDIALRDIAGISVAGAMGFITQEAITPNLSTTRHNPFFTDVIQVGTQDNFTIEEYFRLDVVPKQLLARIMNIHLDLSETTDRTGITGVCVDGDKIVEDFYGKKIQMPFLREVFSVGIEAPRGDRLSFQKVVNFLLWLRKQGFTIGTISTDQYQSSYMREVLTAQGFHTDKVSVDSSDEPYIGLKNILYDQRIELVRNDLRDDELIHLQRVNNKIDHPTTANGGKKGSKDISDSLAGACYTLTTEHIVSKPAPKSAIAAMVSVNGSGNQRNNPLASVFPGFNIPRR